MKVSVKVIANASRCDVLALNEEKTDLKVRLMCPALEGRANRQLIEILADYFKCPKQSIRIASGEHSTHKLIELAGL